MRKLIVLAVLISFWPLEAFARVQMNAFKEQSAPLTPYSKIAVLFEPVNVISAIAERELAERLNKKGVAVFVTATDLNIIHDSPEATEKAKIQNDKIFRDAGIEAVLVSNLVDAGNALGTQMKPSFGYTQGAIGNNNLYLNSTSLTPVTVSFLTWTHNIGLIDYSSKKVVWKAVSGTVGKNEDSMRKELLNKIVKELGKSGLY